MKLKQVKMTYVNIVGEKQRTFDAIVIGSGISGGWAAKELTEKGLKTLVLERGRNIKHVVDYPTTLLNEWELEHRGKLPLKVRNENPIASRCYAFREDAAHFFSKDKDHPYIQKKPFDWIKGYQVGGKSLLWARQVQRWSDFDFEGPTRDGFAVDWPIRYKDLAPWYSYVEKFTGVSGNKDGIPELPDGEFLPPYELTRVEKHFKKKISQHYNDRHVIIARCAHISQANDIFLEQGRMQCQNRTICQRGCPYGGYFSSNSSTLPTAVKTGNLTMKTDSVVESLIYDDKKEKVTGVRVINAHTNEITEYFSRIIFVNASAVNTNLILLNSKSSRFPNGLGNDNELMGKYFAFHNYRAKVQAEYNGFRNFTTDGRRPTNGYIPRFRNVRKQETDFLRGYAAVVNSYRPKITKKKGIGISLKNNLMNPEWGPWKIKSYMMGETIPKETNFVCLDSIKKDSWGMPLLKFSVDYDNNDEKMISDYFEQMSEMFEYAGFTKIKVHDTHQAPGLEIHEMGGVRMGKDPKTSLLNEWNQLHSCKNVFITDGACMTSTGTQNPSLTYMALTARAVDYALKEINKHNL
ncbi:GMC family oxidoreductase [Arenibacter palladensis]|uniref:GMC family oxidoreductase n=1 Tax=Arenibacter palladensis TaxID=237373 RepID=UPI002FD77C63